MRGTLSRPKMVSANAKADWSFKDPSKKKPKKKKEVKNDVS